MLPLMAAGDHWTETMPVPEVPRRRSQPFFGEALPLRTPGVLRSRIHQVEARQATAAARPKLSGFEGEAPWPTAHILMGGGATQTPSSLFPWSATVHCRVHRQINCLSGTAKLQACQSGERGREIRDARPKSVGKRLEGYWNQLGTDSPGLEPAQRNPGTLRERRFAR